MTDRADIVVIGAGAAGLAAAIFAGEAWQGSEVPHILVLDGAKKVGAKILVSGGGRCNVTHEQVSPKDFHGTPHVVRHVLAAFGVEQTRQWMARLGVELKREDTGKLFPVTDRAETVLQALLRRCRELNVMIRTDHRVESLERWGEAPEQLEFLVRHSHGDCRARRVILATGGCSLPRTGSDGHGWEMARALGHSVTPTVPALVPLVLAPTMFHADLSGVSQEVELRTLVDGKPVDRRRGSLLWTHFGISGPVVMDASRFWTMAQRAGQHVELQANFLPDFKAEEGARWLKETLASQPRRRVGTLLSRQLPERFALALCRNAGVDPDRAGGQLPRDQRRGLSDRLTGLVLPVVRDRGWNFAEVTAGGVPLDEINFRTMESRKVPGLYLIGELLDCDGRIGGFNFQWAWATGYLAGRGAVKPVA